MKYVEYWPVMESWNDPRDPGSTVVARFSSLACAEAFAASKANLSAKASPETIVIYDSIHDYENRNNTEVRKAALEKLTDHEKVALGIFR